MSREISPFGLRMPTELRKKMTAEAKRNHRSMNSEIVLRLNASLERENKGGNRLREEGPAYLAAPKEQKEQLIRVISALPAQKVSALLNLLSDNLPGPENHD